MSTACLLATAPAHAQQPAPARDEALAQSLFDAARALMDRGDYARACPMFAESQRLDPGGGTILNLAACREKEGKLGQAWTLFQEALAIAVHDKNANREATARTRIAALEPRVPFVLVSLDVSVPDFVRPELDGHVLPRTALGTRIAVDPGRHGARLLYRDDSATDVVAFDMIEGQVREVTLRAPNMIPVPGGTIPVGTGNTNSHVCQSPGCEAAQPEHAYRIESNMTGGAKFSLGAAIALGIASGAMGIAATSAKSDYQDGCNVARGYCPTQAARDDRDHARNWAIGSTVTLGLGVGLAVLGLVLPRRVHAVPVTGLATRQSTQDVVFVRF